MPGNVGKGYGSRRSSSRKPSPPGSRYTGSRLRGRGMRSVGNKRSSYGGWGPFSRGWWGRSSSEKGDT